MKENGGRMMRTTSGMLPLLLAAGVAVAAAAAQAADSAAPPFDVAYRAWEIVTQVSRDNRKPEITGDCGKTFRPFVVPALRKQTRQEQDAAANACVEGARHACADLKLQRSPDIAAKCREFR
jgi:hypothetical protein